MKILSKVLSITLIIIVSFLSGCSNINNTNLNKDAIDIAHNKEDNNEFLPKKKKDSPIINSGLLLGLSKSISAESSEPSVELAKKTTYRTLWINNIDNKIQVTEGKDFIFLPYENDFYKLEKNEYLFNERPKENYKYSLGYEKNMFLINSRNHTEITQPIFTKSSFDYFKETRSFKRDADRFYFSQQYENRVEEILYAGNKYALIKRTNNYGVGSSGTFSSSGYNIFLADISSLSNSSIRENYMGKEPSKLMDLLDSNAKNKINEYKDNPQELLKSTELISKEAFYDFNTPALKRENGKWNLAIPYTFDYNHEGNGSYQKRVMELTAIDASLSDSLTTDDELSINWEEIKKSYPDTKDAISSPANNLLIVMTTDKLMIFSNPQAGIQEWDYIFDVDPNENVIMNQWAIGDYVKKWDTEVNKSFQSQNQTQNEVNEEINNIYNNLFLGEIYKDGKLYLEYFSKNRMLETFNEDIELPNKTIQAFEIPSISNKDNSIAKTYTGNLLGTFYEYVPDSYSDGAGYYYHSFSPRNQFGVMYSSNNKPEKSEQVFALSGYEVESFDTNVFGSKKELSKEERHELDNIVNDHNSIEDKTLSNYDIDSIEATKIAEIKIKNLDLEMLLYTYNYHYLEYMSKIYLVEFLYKDKVIERFNKKILYGPY